MIAPSGGLSEKKSEAVVRRRPQSDQFFETLALNEITNENKTNSRAKKSVACRQHVELITFRSLALWQPSYITVPAASANEYCASDLHVPSFDELFLMTPKIQSAKRMHLLQLPDHTTHLSDKNFITHVLYKNIETHTRPRYSSLLLQCYMLSSTQLTYGTGDYR